MTATDRRQLLCDWLTANGIDPKRVPIDSDLYVETNDSIRTLHFEQADVDADGNRVLNQQGDGVAVRAAAMPLVVEPPEWWQPNIKPTREQLLDAVAAVHELHREADHRGQTICAHCSALDDQDSTDNSPVGWPCATVQALLKHSGKPRLVTR